MLSFKHMLNTLWVCI